MFLSTLRDVLPRSRVIGKRWTGQEITSKKYKIKRRREAKEEKGKETVQDAWNRRSQRSKVNNETQSVGTCYSAISSERRPPLIALVALPHLMDSVLDLFDFNSKAGPQLDLPPIPDGRLVAAVGIVQRAAATGNIPLLSEALVDLRALPG
nr:hypothetical protein CFP56_10257 [Quercus suber]